MRLRRFCCAWILASIGIAAMGSAALSLPNQLKVQVKGLKATRGNICYSLFASAKGFPSSAQRAVRATCLPVAARQSAIAFRDLKPGTYAVAVFHDVNNDGRLNRNGLGIPTEGFGFSQNPGIVSGPPKFMDAAFFVLGSQNDIQIELKHIL